MAQLRDLVHRSALRNRSAGETEIGAAASTPTLDGFFVRLTTGLHPYSFGNNVPFDLVIYDTGDYWNLSTNVATVPPGKGGLYICNIMLYVTGDDPGMTDAMAFLIAEDGEDLSDAWDAPVKKFTQGDFDITATFMVPCEDGHTFHLEVAGRPTPQFTGKIHGGGGSSHFSATRLGPLP